MPESSCVLSFHGNKVLRFDRLVFHCVLEEITRDIQKIDVIHLAHMLDLVKEWLYVYSVVAATSSSKVNLCPSDVKTKITKNNEKVLIRILDCLDFLLLGSSDITVY